MDIQIKQPFSIKKNLLKGLEIFIYGGIVALISVFSKQQPETTQGIFYTTLILSFLRMAANYMKHI